MTFTVSVPVEQVPSPQFAAVPLHQMPTVANMCTSILRAPHYDIDSSVAIGLGPCHMEDTLAPGSYLLLPYSFEETGFVRIPVIHDDFVPIRRPRAYLTRDDKCRTHCKISLFAFEFKKCTLCSAPSSAEVGMIQLL